MEVVLAAFGDIDEDVEEDDDDEPGLDALGPEDESVECILRERPMVICNRFGTTLDRCRRKPVTVLRVEEVECKWRQAICILVAVGRTLHRRGRLELRSAKLLSRLLAVPPAAAAAAVEIAVEA